MSQQEIVDDFPDSTFDDIRSVLAYVRAGSGLYFALWPSVNGHTGMRAATRFLADLRRQLAL